MYLLTVWDEMQYTIDLVPIDCNVCTAVYAEILVIKSSLVRVAYG